MFAKKNYEPASNAFRKIYNERKNRNVLLCTTFSESSKCSDWFKLHKIAENFYSI